MKAVLDDVISLNFLKSILYETKRLKQLKKMIISTFVPIEYIYIAIRRRM